MDAAPRVLASIPGRLGEYATRQLTRRGIEVHTDTRLESAVNGHVVLSNGVEVDAETLVWSAGVTPSTLGRDFGLPVDERGAIIVGPTLQVGRRDVFALGDGARVPNAGEAGAFDPPTCQHALRQARTLVRTLRALRGGEAARPYRYRTRGQMAILGRRRAIADVFGVRLVGWPAWFLTRAYHLNRLPLRRRRFRVAADWTVATVLPWDITQLGSLGRARALGPRGAPARPAAGPTADRISA